MQLPEMLHERSTASKSCGRSTFVPGREIFQIFPTRGPCKRDARAEREERRRIERMNNLSIHISIPPSRPHLRASNPSRQQGESFKAAHCPSTPQISVVSVAAIVANGRATLLDRHGNKTKQCMSIEDLGTLTPAGFFKVTWSRRAHAMVEALERRTTRRVSDPWMRRATNLAVSFRLRRLDGPRRSGRRRFDRYATTSWSEAARRLVMQGHNRFRVRNRSGWERWAYTVSNNEKKRVDAYEQRRTDKRQAGA